MRASIKMKRYAIQDEVHPHSIFEIEITVINTGGRDLLPMTQEGQSSEHSSFVLGGDVC
jgi:hypothetical protein